MVKSQKEHRVVVEGTIVYMIKSHGEPDRFELKEGDIVLGVDNNNTTWYLIRQNASRQM